MNFVVMKKRTVIKYAIVAVFLAAVTAVVSVTGSAAVFQGKTVRKIPIYCVDTEEKKVAISFDASWGASRTMSILETLKTYDVPATFFAVGIWAEKYPDELKTLADSGRLEIATHSNTHPDMAKLSRKQIALELETSIKTIEEISGEKIDLFRAPYGSYSDALLEEAEKLGLYTVQWDVDTLDWKGLSASEIAARAVGGAKNGSIILMHNDGEHTAEALPAIITGLKNKGFTLVTIGDLIYRENYTIDHTGKQIRSE